MKTDLSMPQIMSNPRYRGKHLILANGYLYTAKTGEGASNLLAKLRKKNPRVAPEITYLPKEKYIII